MNTPRSDSEHEEKDEEEDDLRSVALQNAHSILAARQRAEADLMIARNELRRQSELLQVTLGSIGDGVATTDMEGNVVFLNAAAQALTGWTEEQARGVPLSEVFRIVHEDTRAQVVNPAELALREGRTARLANHTVLIARDGSETPIDDSAAPIRDSNGRIHGAVLVFRNIDERRQSERLQRQLAAIVESTNDAIISKDRSGLIVSWNAAAERLYGYSRDEVVGKPITILIPEDKLEEEAALMKRLLRGERVSELETVRVSRSGKRIDVSITVSPVRDNSGRVIGASKIARDITGRLRADRALRESEAQFRELANALPQIVWTARADGFVDYFNERWYEFTGFPRDHFGDETLLRAVHEDDAQSIAEQYYESISTGELFETECRFRDWRSDGYRWFLCRAYPVRNGDGSVSRWFGTCTDIDATKRAELITRFLADATATLADLVDGERALGRVAQLAVPAFADWCAIDLRDSDGELRRVAMADSGIAPGRHDTAGRGSWVENFLDRTEAIQRVLRSGESEWVNELQNATSRDAPPALQDEHDRIPHAWICCPLSSQTGTIGVMSFATTESGRVYTIDDLLTAEDLAHRAAIAMSNANLVAALRERDQRKDEFLAILAHELRNPLAPIRNAIQIIRVKAPPIAELEWARDVIERQVHQMNLLVDDLLDVSRVTRGKIGLRKERATLGTIIDSAVEAARPLIEKMEHSLEVVLPELPIYVDADVTRLAQVLANLLNNAAKYTRHGGLISLTAAREGGEVVIHVVDNGIGISPEMLPRIFDMFTQADRSLESSEGGLGIGLTLVQLLVELHGGSVRAHSKGIGSGSRFEVRLPAPADQSAPDETGSGKVNREVTSVSGLKVLVVDDNEDAAETLAMLLEHAGCEVRTAGDGVEAVEMASSYNPDVAILDIGLPKLNGYDAARRIREKHGRSKYLVALTGWGQEEDRRRSVEAGFDKHLTKPVSMEVLKRVLGEVKRR